ncbi:MAG: hypothetical protein J6P16_00720 [Eubacterium sp.]|nr:hypothetical protein [Eubacterium sp.]
MKAVSDYIIGSTAVKIIDTGRRIRVIDVKKQTEKKHFIKISVAVIIAAALSLFSSLGVVRYSNSESILNKKNYILKTQIERLQRDNDCMLKNLEENSLSYSEIFDRATHMGMRFPSGKNIRTYKYKKGSCIRMHAAPIEYGE